MFAFTLLGIGLLILLFWDGFETIILPRRVTRKFRLARAFYAISWRVWAAVFRRLPNHKRRDQALSAYGPLCMIVLLMLWATGLITGFGLIHYGLQSHMMAGHDSVTSLRGYLYMSGTTFLTLGLGDVIPMTTVARTITVGEAGMGFGFLALVIGYMPVLHGAFSQREINIGLLDARAGTPPAAVELWRRHALGQSLSALDTIFAEWERWSAELLQSHISYPVLCYYRSQHDNQSWLGALTTILDACSLVLAGAQGPSRWQAQLTFAMARHAVVDLAQILNAAPQAPDPDRLPDCDIECVHRTLKNAGVDLPPISEFATKLRELRRLYEPYVYSLSCHILVTLPAWMRKGNPPDNWQTSAWERRSKLMSRHDIFQGLDDHDL